MTKFKNAKPLPENLYAAHDWISSAGEWSEALANPEQYAVDAARNAEQNEGGPEEDLAAFRREHAEHRHTTLGDHMVGTSRPADVPTTGAGILAARSNAENRAWCVIEEWCQSVRDHSLPYVRVEHVPASWPASGYPPAPKSPGEEHYQVSLWHRGEECVRKTGTSRVDALAHLASWCQAEMPV